MILVHFLALKGRNIPAHGNALGKNITMVKALKGRNIKITIIKGSNFM